METKIPMKQLEKSFETPVENNPGGLLALFWRKILVYTRNASKRNSLIDTVILENKIKNGTDDKASTSLKHRIKNYSESPKLSWQVFVLLTTRILRVSNLKITVEFTYHDTDFVISQDIFVNTDEDLSAGLKSIDGDSKTSNGKRKK